MKHSRYAAILLLFCYSFTACTKDSGTVPSSEGGFVTGKITDAAGNSLANVKVTIEHTLWAANYVFATTDNNGNYKIAIPAEPAGDWTAKSQIEKNAYGEDYTFDLACSNTNAFNNTESVTRNFTWKISGKIPGADGYY